MLCCALLLHLAKTRRLFSLSADHSIPVGDTRGVTRAPQKRRPRGGELATRPGGVFGAQKCQVRAHAAENQRLRPREAPFRAPLSTQAALRRPTGLST